MSGMPTSYGFEVRWPLGQLRARILRRRAHASPPLAFALYTQDAVALCFCEGCSLCQELNEVDLRALAAQQQPAFVVTAVPVGTQGVTYTMPPEVAKM